MTKKHIYFSLWLNRSRQWKTIWQKSNELQNKNKPSCWGSAAGSAKLSALTFPGGLKAVEDVYSLDVIGERGVGEQGAVPVDCVQGKFKGEFLCSGGAALNGFKYSSWGEEKKNLSWEQDLWIATSFSRNCNRFLNTIDIQVNDQYDAGNYSYIIDAAAFAALHSSVAQWRETDLECGLGDGISSDLHSVAVVCVIIGN